MAILLVCPTGGWPAPSTATGKDADWTERLCREDGGMGIGLCIENDGWGKSRRFENDHRKF